MKLTEQDIQKFWSKVDRSGGPDACWPWLAGMRNGLYGQIWINGKQNTATHVSLALDGRPLRKGFYALHHCDNEPCVNPRHLYEGTQQQNVSDAISRGHWQERERHWNCKIVDNGRLEVVRLVESGLTHQKVADKYGVSRQTISRIVSDNWYEKNRLSKEA